MSNDDYDPGPPYEPPSYRRRRQRKGEHDDAWAAADEDDFYDDGVEIEDLAAGYVWDDKQRERGRSNSRSRHDARYNRGDVYRRSPSHYRDRMKRGEYGEYRADAHPDKPKRGPLPYESSPGQNWGTNIPFWQIVILVTLALLAFLAVALACVTLLLI